MRYVSTSLHGQTNDVRDSAPKIGGSRIALRSGRMEAPEDLEWKPVCGHSAKSIP